MKIVTRIEMLDVTEDEFYNLFHYDRELYVMTSCSDSGKLKDEKITIDLIKGRKFCINNEKIVIGWANGVEELLNIPLTLIDNAQRDIEIASEQAYHSGFHDGKNIIWTKIENFFKPWRKQTDYWFLPPIFLFIIGIILGIN